MDDNSQFFVSVHDVIWTLVVKMGYAVVAAVAVVCRRNP
jgi:hypothetical protein